MAILFMSVTYWVIKKIKLLFLLFPFISAGQQLGFALDQINGQAILDQNLTGRGIKIGIIDGGFLQADRSKSLQHLFAEGLIAGYRDYLDSTAVPFDGKQAWDDAHGTEVWKFIGGLNAEKNIQFGLATEATYYLARTDHGAYERRREEENAAKAMLWMAKQGVQIINISLGYNYGFTDKSENYQPSQMDGRSALLTRVVDKISEEYGILIIVAAGNDGDQKWKIVDSPADAKHALTVGATKYTIWDDMSYSSRGPEELAYVKPEVSCFASSGTSFSTPIITGLAACLLEKKPTLTGAELKQIIVQSCNLAYPNNFIGYGVPNAETALALLDQKEFSNDKLSVKTKKNVVDFGVKSDDRYVAVYHKKGWKVVGKDVIKSPSKSLKIKKPKDIESSTIITKSQQLEIIWE